MLDFFKNVGLGELIGISIVLNLFIMGLSIGLYYLLTHFSSKALIQVEHPAITKRDVLLTLVVLLCNALILILGVLGTKHGFIHVSEHRSPAVIGIQTLCLIMGMDVLMYVFHRIAHLPLFYSLAHERHHEHESVNEISLFVLHPLEALGFGLLLLFLLWIYPFDTLSISIYLLINVVWGTLGHIPKDIFSGTLFERLTRDFLCLTRFHNVHHQTPGCNYGFYTLLWDKLFRTHKVD